LGDTAKDPVDHDRTTRKHAGENWKNTAAMPGLIAVGSSSAAIFAALYAFATMQLAGGVTLGIIAAILLVGGLCWLGWQRRRVRRVEVRYLRQHPDADDEPPTS
jgi:Flp pilus assembly protein TadB